MNTDSQLKKEKGSSRLYVYPFGLEQMDLDQQIKFINRIGFRGFAWEGTDQSTKTRIEDFYSSRLTIENNLKIAGIYFFHNLDQNDDSLWMSLLPTLSKYKIPLWPVFSSKQQNRNDLLEEKLILMCDKAKEFGIDVIIYPHDASYEGSVLISAEEALPFIQKLKKENLFLSFHLCHELRAGNVNRIKDAIQNVRPYIKLVSISGADTLLYQNRGEDWSDAIKPLGKGTFDTENFCQILKSCDYRGPVVLHTYGISEDPEIHFSGSLKIWESYQQ